MTVNSKREGVRLTVTIQGTVDVDTVADLEDALTEETLDGVEELFFDLQDMEYTTSVGLRAMLNAFQILDERGGRMVIQHLNEDVKEIFDMTGFTDFLEIED
jgi:anti-sigma B factor antagonist